MISDRHLLSWGTAALLGVFVAACGGDGSTPHYCAYVANFEGNSVSVINTASNQMAGTIPVGYGPIHIAITPNGRRAYVANHLVQGDLSIEDAVSVIDTATNRVMATVPVGVHASPVYVAITPDGSRAYVISRPHGGVSVIDTAANRVVATVPLGATSPPLHVAISPDGSRAYVASQNPGSLSVIDTASNQVVATLPLGRDTSPLHAAITPDGSRAYIANVTSDTVSVLDTASSELIATVAVGTRPMFIAFGLAPRDGSAADRAREAGASGR